MGATGRQLHIDRPLSEMAINYRPQGFIADMIAPTVPVGNQSNLYTIWDQGTKFRRYDTARSPAKPANVIVPEVSSAAYFAKNYALKTRVPIEDISNADPGLWGGDRQAKTEFVLDALLLDWEVRLALQITSGSNVGSYAAVSSGWAIGGGASGAQNPCGDIWTAMDNVLYSTGYRPNRAVFGIKAWDAFRRNANVRALMYPHGGAPTPNTPPLVSADAAANLIGVETILIGGAFYNTAEEGQTQSLSAIWDDSVLLYYAPQRPSLDRPSFMYSFRWRRPMLPDMSIEVHPYDQKIKAEEIEAGYYQDEKITAAALGYLLIDVTSV